MENIPEIHQMDKLNVLSDTFLLSSAIVNNVSELISLQSISVLTQSSLLLPLQNFNPVSAFFLHLLILSYPLH